MSLSDTDLLLQRSKILEMDSLTMQKVSTLL